MMVAKTSSCLQYQWLFEFLRTKYLLVLIGKEVAVYKTLVFGDLHRNSHV